MDIAVRCISQVLRQWDSRTRPVGDTLACGAQDMEFSLLPVVTAASWPSWCPGTQGLFYRAALSQSVPTCLIAELQPPRSQTLCSLLVNFLGFPFGCFPSLYTYMPLNTLSSSVITILFSMMSSLHLPRVPCVPLGYILHKDVWLQY